MLPEFAVSFWQVVIETFENPVCVSGKITSIVLSSGKAIASLGHFSRHSNNSYVYNSANALLLNSFRFIITKFNIIC